LSVEKITISKTSLNEIEPLRNLFLEESNFQIRYDAVHRRGWSDSYLLMMDGQPAGYGSVKGMENLADRDSIFEFYVIPSFRGNAELLFTDLVKISGATLVVCQSNEALLTSLLYKFCDDQSSDVILFKDEHPTAHRLPGVVFRKRRVEDKIFDHTSEPVGEYLLESQGSVLATGGYLLHYNFPFADLYMEVREDFRRKGLGSFLLQEIKRECYSAGRVPAARCNATNHASRATLLKAGMRIAGCMLKGVIK
jgi:GNAT superfamily N-acetyltransferase